MTAAAPAKDRTVLWGLLAVLGAFCCPPVGIVFGVLCLQDTKKHNKSPFFAYVVLGIVAAGLLVHVILFAADAYPFIGG